MRGKTDHNQSEIVNTLRSIGATVTDLSQVGGGVPDILIGMVANCPNCQKAFRQNLLAEIKSEIGTLTPAQVEFHRLWRGQLLIIRTVDDVLALAKKSSQAPAFSGNQAINLNILPSSVKVKPDSQALKDLRREVERIISKYEKLISA